MERTAKRIRTEPKVYLGFGGCFCPPHKGHFDSVQKYWTLYQPDVLQLVIAEDAEQRHGVPIEEIKQLWKIYLKLLVPINGDNTQIAEIVSASEPVEKAISLGMNRTDVGRVVVVVGSDYDKETVVRYESLMKRKTEKTRPENRKQYELLVNTRDGKLSATEFVACLLAEHNCDEFLPHALPASEKKRVTSKLRTFKLK